MGRRRRARYRRFLRSPRARRRTFVQSPSFFAPWSIRAEAVAIGADRCNDTPHKVMAAVATDDGKVVTSRVVSDRSGKCLHPDVTGMPKQIYSFAEASTATNRAIRIKTSR